MTDLTETLDGIGCPHLLVLGDLILDRYTWGNAERVSPEAPVLVMDADDEEARLGGAASVALLARGLDAKVTLAGVVGCDNDGQLLRRMLKDFQIDTGLVISAPQRPTTVKERFVGRASGRHSHQILRVDRELRDPIDFEIQRTMIGQIRKKLVEMDAVLISDYGKGVCTPRLIKDVIDAARELKIPVVVDPCIKADYASYSGANLLTPNRPETEWVTGLTIHKPQQALNAAYQLCNMYTIGAALVTLDRQGMALCLADGNGEVVAAKARTVYDVTGAGDMVLAMVGLGLAAHVPLSESVHLANRAAGLEVERFGIEPIRRSELREELTGNLASHKKIVSVGEIAQRCELYRKEDKTVVFTNGCFDLMHVGHAAYLEEAAGLGQVLVVAVNSDRTVQRLKGEGRPIIGQEDRAHLLAALACVDHVVILDDDTPHDLLRAIRPDILVKGGTYCMEQVVGREVVEAYGGEVCVTGQTPGTSTTGIVTAIQSGLRFSQTKGAEHVS